MKGTRCSYIDKHSRFSSLWPAKHVIILLLLLFFWSCFWLLIAQNRFHLAEERDLICDSVSRSWCFACLLARVEIARTCRLRSSPDNRTRHDDDGKLAPWWLSSLILTFLEWSFIVLSYWKIFKIYWNLSWCLSNLFNSINLIQILAKMCRDSTTVTMTMLSWEESIRAQWCVWVGH